MNTEAQILRHHNIRSRRCTAMSADASPRRPWAVHGSDPLRWALNAGGRTPVGPHGFHARTRPPASPDSGECTTDLAHHLRIHAQSCSRVGRLLCDRDIPTSRSTGGMDRIIEYTPTELGEE